MSEPHIIIPTVPITLNFIKIVEPRDPYLPDTRLSHDQPSVEVLFVVDRLILHGRYHPGGYFVSDRRCYRGRDHKLCGLSDVNIRGIEFHGTATHWAYMSKIPHPDLL